MPTRGNSVGSAVHDVAEHASALARLEAELAALELREKLRSLGAGGGLLVGAALLALFSLAFLLAGIAAALATTVDLWLALLIVAIALLAVGFGIGLAGISLVRRGVPPVPERAVAEAKLTAEALKSNGHA